MKTSLKFIYVLNACLDSDQTSTAIVCRITLEPINGFSSNLHRYTTRASLRADLILVTLILFSRSLKDLYVRKFH